MPFPSLTKNFHHEAYPAIYPTRPELSALGKVVLITGAGTGIGRATALAFAQANARIVVLTGRRFGPLEETKSMIDSQSLPSTILIHTLDVSSEDNVTTVFNDVAQNHGPIDICIHGGGHLATAGKLHESTLENFWTSMEINIKGSFLINHAFLNQQYLVSPSQECERILIFMSSAIAHLDAKINKTAPAAYAISKLAQAKMIEYSASENSNVKGFRAYVVQPGTVATEMSQRSIDMSPPGTRESLTWDSPELPACFFVWLASGEGKCVPSGRFLWANWDVDELRERREDFEENPLALTQTLHGWPFEYMSD